MRYRVNHLIYAAGKDIMNTIRTGITFRSPVNTAVLEKALKDTVSRFPYFAVRLERIGEEYFWCPNKLPMVISHGKRALTLNSEESNYHVFAFSCEGNNLYIDTSHFITDGMGKFSFIKTLLYLYLSEIYPDEEFDTSYIALPGSDIHPKEMADYPYPDELLPTKPIGSITRPENVYLPDNQPSGYTNRKKWTSFCFKIRQKHLMSYVSTVDGSPASFIATLIYRAISDLHPDNSLPLVCGMQHQYRKALGNMHSHNSHVNIIPINYPERLKGKSIELLNTMARGSLVIRADVDNDMLTINEHIKNEKKIKEMTLSEKHEYMRSVLLDGIGTNTFEVSYTGRVPWNGLDKYITNFVPYIDMSLSGGISAEIFSLGDYFSINIMQRSEDPEYVDRIKELLDELDIDFTFEKPEYFCISDFELPD